LNARFLAAVVVVLTLVIGFLIGLLTTRVTEQRRPGPDRRHPPMGGRMLDGGFFTERMEHMLDVGDDQRDTVRAILEAHADRFLAMHEQQSESMKILMDTLLTDLGDVLTEEQLSTFEEHLNSRRGFRRGPRFDKGPP